MNEIINCCNSSHTLLSFPSHLEDVHVGPKILSPTLLCGVCSFRVEERDVHLMIRHCAKAGHDTSDISSDWDRIFQLEEMRLQKMVRVGVEAWRTQMGSQEPRIQEKFETNISHAAVSCSAESERGKGDLSEDRGSCDRSLIMNHQREAQDFTNGSSMMDELENIEEVIQTVYEPTDIVDSNLYASTPDMILDDSALSQIENESVWRQENSIPAIRSSEPALKQKRKCMNNPPIRPCSRCPFKEQNGVLSGCLRHVYVHDKSLHPFQCVGCSYTATVKKDVMFHQKSKRNRKDCGRGHKNIQTPESIQQLRNLLADCFPTIDWNKKYPPGTVIMGTTL